jgi:type I restriction enzyme, S subunit
MNGLPSGWKMEQLADVCEVNPREPGPQDPSTPVSFIPMPAVSEVEGTILEHDTKPFCDVAKGYTRFREGDVIFAKITPCMENGKSAIARGLHNRLACGSTEFHVLRPNEKILSDYLWRFLRQKSFRTEAERYMTGAVGQRRVPAQYLNDASIPVAPLSQQCRIVARLNVLFRYSKDARENLVRIPRLVERYKQAILTAAFKGDLTGNDASEWPSVTLGDVIAGIDAGKNIRCEERPPRPKERGIVKISSVTWGEFDPFASKTPIQTVSLDRQTVIRPGDFLISRANTLELVGACVIVGALVVNNLYLSDKVLRLRFNQPIKQWVLQFLRSEDGRRQIEDLATGNQVSMRNISQSSIRAIRLPLPPQETRDLVLKAVEQAMSSITSTLSDATRATTLLDRLDQTTLAKAFRGELLTASDRDATLAKPNGGGR